MTIQQWLFSFKGRIGRRDFWIWMVIWVLAMAALFYAVSFELLASQTPRLCWFACSGQRRCDCETTARSQ
jgi:uncharacterized membrane protein YhaH (DUF805 family)